MAPRFRFQHQANEFAKAMRDVEKPIARAATAAVKRAAGQIKKEGAAAIKAAGFSARSSRVLRYDLNPEKGDSIDISATFKFRIGYFNVFEEGATITGKPLIWIPTDNVPFGSRGRRLTPKEYVDRVGPLFSARGSAKPMLVGKGSRSSGILSASRSAVRVRKSAVRKGTLQSQAVPLFIGVKSVTIPKKFDIKGIVQRVGAQIPEYYKQIASEINRQG